MGSRGEWGWEWEEWGCRGSRGSKGEWGWEWEEWGWEGEEWGCRGSGVEWGWIGKWGVGVSGSGRSGVVARNEVRGLEWCVQGGARGWEWGM